LPSKAVVVRRLLKGAPVPIGVCCLLLAAGGAWLLAGQAPSPTPRSGPTPGAVSGAGTPTGSVSHSASSGFGQVSQPPSQLLVSPGSSSPSNGSLDSPPSRGTYQRLSGAVPALPPGSRPEGPSDESQTLELDVTLSPRDPSGLEAFAQAVSTPGSSQFRHFLTSGQFAARFGPEPSSVVAVRSWLDSQGLRVGASIDDGLIVPVRGDLASVARAFAVGFENYLLPSGRTARLPTEEPRLPAGLSGLVSDVVGLDDLARPTPQLARSDANRAATAFGGVQGGTAPATSPGEPHAATRATGPTPTSSCVSAIDQSGGGFTGDELAQAYSASPLYASGDEGQGVTIALYELEPYLPSDIAAYDNCYSPVLDPTVSDVSVNGADTNSCGSLSATLCQPSGSGEAALDIEMTEAIAPQANVEVYVGSDLGQGASNAQALSTYAAMVDQDTARVISTSWGECERDLGTSQIRAEASVFEQAAAQGQTIVAASGDSGSEDCLNDGSLEDQVLAVDDPASQPWVTGAGGTTVNSLGPPPSEQVWDNGDGSGGGGISSVWTMPSWQAGAGVQNSFSSSSACPLSSGAATASCREVPDVSADADPVTSPFAEYWDGQWGGVGGTSMAAPLWASVFALSEQGQSSSLGDANPALYEAGCLASTPFYDVTSGDNQLSAPFLPTASDGTVLTGGPYYPATSNYDLASGLGSPDTAALAADLRNPRSSSPCQPHPNCNSSDHVSASRSNVTAAQASGLGFTSLSAPVRIADTRAGASDPATYAGDTLCPGGQLTVDIPSAQVPSGAGAIVAQVTAVSPSAPGFLSAFPAGTAWPGTANVNFTTGQTVGNLVTVGLGTDSVTGSPAITVYNGSGTGADTDFTLDLYGYYASQTTGSGDAYVPLRPSRIFDTRAGSGYAGSGETLSGGGSVSVPVAGVGGVAQGASAVVVNVAVTDTTALSYIQGYPTGSPPSSSTPTVNQNWSPGETLSTKAIIGIGPDGSITLYNARGNADVVVDVDGYFTPPGQSGALFTALSSPVRLLDTRPSGVAGGSSGSAQVGDSSGVPSSATAGVLNVVDIATGPNYLTVFPSGQSLPLAADVNYVYGDLNTILDNASYGTVGTSGAVGIYNGSAGAPTANIVVDEFGYFSNS
jgi:hypothetical protein